MSGTRDLWIKAGDNVLVRIDSSNRVRSRLAVATFGNRFEKFRSLAFGNEHTGIVVRQREVPHEARLLFVG